MNEKEQKALQILQDIYVQNLEQNERIYALIQEYEQSNQDSQESQTDEFPFKIGDIVQLSQKGTAECLTEQSFNGKAVFQGQSETREDCSVLEILEDKSRIGCGGGQKKWWNFNKQNLKYLEKVTEYKMGDRVKLVSDYWGDNSYNPVWGGREGHILGSIDRIDGKGEYTEYNIAWDNGKGNSSYKYDQLQLATESDEEKAKEQSSPKTPVKKTRKKKSSVTEAGAGGEDESAPKSDVASSEKVFCTLCNKEHTRGTHD